MKAGEEFFNFYNHDFARVAVALPAVKVADPTFNGFQIVEMIQEAAQRKAVVVLFPELGISAYSCEDLFHQRALLEG
ncbi:MAG TPA: nitrilase-related carbon-nitrogen hydrolase, partial [Candidatus Binataceae bacterium]|nr:nitrilase-related carbon-nitrogen hydrolase [Candidatus Binataceae bacterium]